MRTLFAPVIALLLSAPATADLVINEVDYDQPGTDAAEYIELKNNGPGAVNLIDYEILLINGSGGATPLSLALGGVALALLGGIAILRPRPMATA